MSALMKLAPLAGKKLTDLTLADVTNVVSMLGIEVKVTEELQAAALALLQGKDIHTVSDMIQSPESVTMLVEFIKNGLSPREPVAVAHIPEDVPLEPVTQLFTAPTGWRLPQGKLSYVQENHSGR